MNSGFQKGKYALVEDVRYFKTENYVGIYAGQHFTILPQHDVMREVLIIEAPKTLKDLDKAVYDLLDEHLETVMLQEIE